MKLIKSHKLDNSIINVSQRAIVKRNCNCTGTPVTSSANTYLNA